MQCVSNGGLLEDDVIETTIMKNLRTEQAHHGGSQVLTAAECKAKGNACLQAKEFTTAISWYTAAIEKDGTNHVFYSNRSAAHLNLGDATAALADAESCIKVKPDWAKGYSRKGAALHKLNRMAESVASYEAGENRPFKRSA